MLVGIIRANAVIRLGVGEDGQICSGVVGQVCRRNLDGDRLSGGRRGRAADGDGQLISESSHTLDCGGQTGGPIGEPAGNIVTCRNTLDLFAVQLDRHIGFGDGLICLAADGHIVNIRPVQAGVGVGSLGGIIRSAAVSPYTGIHAKGSRSAVVPRNRKAFGRFIFFLGAGLPVSVCDIIEDLRIVNIQGGHSDREAAAIARAFRNDGRSGQRSDLLVACFAKIAPCCDLATVFILEECARLDGGICG